MGRSKRQLELIVLRRFNWWWFERMAPLAGVRSVKNLIPWFRRDGLNVFFLPINEDIELGDDTAVPLAALDEMIDRASHRVVVDVCFCRKTLACKKYPEDIGCLMMGRSALEIDPGISRQVTPGEAKEHARRAVEAGLVPFMGKARVDNFVFGIKNHRQLLSVCFCCECCCISRFARHISPELRAENLNMLEGLTIEVGEQCDGCGACEKLCFLEVMKVVDGRAVIGDGCVGCGRCATACKSGAITMSLDNPEMVEEVAARIEELVDITDTKRGKRGR